MSTVASFRLGWWWVTTPVSFADGPPAEGEGLVLVLSPEGADCQGGAAAAHVMHADRPGAVFRAQGRQCGGGIVTVVHRRSPMPASFNAAETNRFREAPISTGYPDRLNRSSPTSSGRLCSIPGLENPRPGSMMTRSGATPALSTAST